MDIDLQTARVGIGISAVLTVILGAIAQTTESPLFYLLTAVGFAATLFFGWFNRCPSCKRGLGRTSWFAEYCPYCGEPL